MWFLIHWKRLECYGFNFLPRLEGFLCLFLNDLLYNLILLDWRQLVLILVLKQDGICYSIWSFPRLVCFLRCFLV